MNQEKLTLENFNHVINSYQQEEQLIYLEAFKKVLSENLYLLDSYNEAGLSLLQHAILSNQLGPTKILLDLGANIELTIQALEDYPGYKIYNGLNALACSKLNYELKNKKLTNSNNAIQIVLTKISQEESKEIFKLLQVYNEKVQLGKKTNVKNRHSVVRKI